MNRTLAVAVLLLTPFSLFRAACGQGAKEVARPRNQDSVRVGTVQLSLGVPRKEVSAQILRAGYKTLDLPAEGQYAKVAVTDRDLTDRVQSAMAAVDNEGVLYFKNEALVRIQRKVTDETATGRDLAFALYAIVQDLKNRGGSQCSVNTAEETYTDTPGMDAKTVLLTCQVGESYRTTHIRWVTNEKMRDQFPVYVFQELWR